MFHHVEEKKSILVSHIVMVAVAFGRIKLSHEATIHIKKNPCVSGHSYSAAKLSFKNIGEEIVRDGKHLHHLEDRLFFKDYW